jgi:long-subunit acyl-CoA synthetase (AMP-forming)
MKGVAAQSPLKRKLFHYALRTARERNHAQEFHQPVSPWLEWKYQKLDKIIFDKVRQRLGGNVL